MIVQRMRWRIKTKYMQDAIDLGIAEMERVGRPYRTYSVAIGEMNTLTTDMEFDSYEEREQYWKAYFESQEGQDFVAKFSNEYTVDGTFSSEILNPLGSK